MQTAMVLTDVPSELKSIESRMKCLLEQFPDLKEKSYASIMDKYNLVYECVQTRLAECKSAPASVLRMARKVQKMYTHLTPPERLQKLRLQREEKFRKHCVENQADLEKM